MPTSIRFIPRSDSRYFEHYSSIISHFAPVRCFVGRGRTMLGYAVRRIAGTVPTLLILVTLSFFVIRLAPGGPFDGERALTPQVRANLDRLYGLDRPLSVQYLHYLEGLAHGDFGLSYKLRDESVAGLIAQGLPVSVTVGLAALVLAVFCGVPLGIFAALRRGGIVDYAVTGLA